MNSAILRYVPTIGSLVTHFYGRYRELASYDDVRTSSKKKESREPTKSHPSLDTSQTYILPPHLPQWLVSGYYRVLQGTVILYVRFNILLDIYKAHDDEGLHHVMIADR